MSPKPVDSMPERVPPAPVMDPGSLPNEFLKSLKISPAVDEDLTALSQLRSGSEPWKARGEKPEESLQALTKLRPFSHVARLQNQTVGYVTVERDGPVPGAAYLRNILVKAELGRKGLGMALLTYAIQVASDMHRKTLALRVDPSNAPAVGFYRKAGFTTVATVVSKKSGKLRLLMSREL